MRSRGSSFRRPRKARPSVTLKQKVARRDSTCEACRTRILKGQSASYVRTRLRRYHDDCLPANWAAQAGAAVVVPLPTNPADAKFKAMEAMENALVVVAKDGGITPEMEKEFKRYQAFKAHALRPNNNEHESIQGFRMAMVTLVKLIF